MNTVQNHPNDDFKHATTQDRLDIIMNDERVGGDGFGDRGTARTTARIRYAFVATRELVGEK